MPDLTRGHTYAASDEVTHSNLNNLVGNATINDNAVTTAKINDEAVTTAKVADEQITYVKMQETATDNRILGAATAGVVGEVQVATDMISDGAVTVAKIASGALMPVGAMTMWYTASAPTGWLICDGTAIDSAHTALIAIVGANTPNLKGRSPIGAGQATNVKWTSGSDYTTAGTDFTIATEYGKEDHKLVETEITAHTHDTTVYNTTQSVSGGGGTGVRGTGASAVTSDSTPAAGTDVAHNNLHPVFALNFIIKHD